MNDRGREGTWDCTLRWGSPPDRTVRSAVRSPGRWGSSPCHRRRRTGGPDPKWTSCPTKTEERKNNLKSSLQPNTAPRTPLTRQMPARSFLQGATCGCHLVVVQRRAFAPVLRRRADERDVVVARHAVLLPPVQLDHVLTAHLHQPVHQAQRDEPGQGTREKKNLVPSSWKKTTRLLTDQSSGRPTSAVTLRSAR